MAVHGLLENLEAALPRKIAVNVATPGGPTAGEGDVFFESMYDAQNTPVALNETVIHRIGFRGRGVGPHRPTQGTAIPARRRRRPPANVVQVLVVVLRAWADMF